MCLPKLCNDSRSEEHTWWHKQYVGSFGSTGMSNTWTSGASRETATASDLGPSDSTLQKAPTYTVWTSTLVIIIVNYGIIKIIFTTLFTTNTSIKATFSFAKIELWIRVWLISMTIKSFLKFLMVMLVFDLKIWWSCMFLIWKWLSMFSDLQLPHSKKHSSVFSKSLNGICVSF